MDKHEHDHHSAGTSHLTTLVVVMLAFAFIASLGFALWPTRGDRTGMAAVSDGAKVERAPSPTAKTGEMPATDKTPAVEKSPAQQPSGG